MKRRAQKLLAAIPIFLAFLVPPLVRAQEQKEWTWKDREGKTRTRAELGKILAEHRRWSESDWSRGSQADLGNADLNGAILGNAVLTGADLTGADLKSATLNGARLEGALLNGARLEGALLNDAHLEGAILNGADLSNAVLDGAQLNGASLPGVRLSGAHLNGAHLEGAVLNDADLEGAVLNDADLTGAYLIGAHLKGAILDDTDLRKAHLDGIHLSNASLIRAHLNDASLIPADPDGVYQNDAKLILAHLDNAKLVPADLNGAHLEGADLNGAHLDGATLNGAHLDDALLEGALLNGAHLEGATFEPKTNPKIRFIATAENLEFMTYERNPDALAQLRKQFKENGFQAQERKITYALSRRKAERGGPLEWGFQTVAFDLTCQYGMNPGRALKIWLAVLLICALVYAVFAHVRGESGVYRILKLGEVGREVSLEIQIRPRPASPDSGSRHAVQLIWRECRVLFWALFFSLISAFNIGFRDINFGRWLRLLPRGEYDLKAKGWTRTVAGFQSLVSVYLIALWVLTYFGRPFE